MYKNLIKPIADKLLGIILFIVLFPIMALVGALLFLTNRGKIFFRQIRPGKNEIPFTIVKFRTMSDKEDSEGNLLPDAERLTTIGRFIRKTSLDELPQLWNVIIGEMSFVGPRPLLPEYLPLYNDFQRQRHKVKPGITGWAQVNGRNSVSWNEKFILDNYYVDHISFTLDLKIILLTVIKVLKSEGINSENSDTAAYFNGNE